MTYFEMMLFIFKLYFLETFSGPWEYTKLTCRFLPNLLLCGVFSLGCLIQEKILRKKKLHNLPVKWRLMKKSSFEKLLHGLRYRPFCAWKKWNVAGNQSNKHSPFLGLLTLEFLLVRVLLTHYQNKMYIKVELRASIYICGNIYIRLNISFCSLANHNLLLKCIHFMSHIFSFTGQTVKPRNKQDVVPSS